MRKKEEIFEKRYLNRVAAYALTAAMAIGIMIFLGYHVVDRVTPGLDLVDAVPSTVTEIIEVDGYIIRDEEPLYANTSKEGSVVPAISNGGRVAVGSKLVDVYSDYSADSELRLAELDEQIALLTKSKSENRSVQSTAGIEADIYETVSNIRRYSENGEYADALSLRAMLLVDIKKKAIVTGEITDYDALISNLEAEKTRLRSNLGACMETVYSGKSGYYFSEFDGYGEIFTADSIDSMTYEQFVNMTLSDPYYGSRLSIGVMVHNYTWYISCIMDRASADRFEISKKYPMEFPYSNETLDMEAVRIINDVQGENSIIVFSCEKMPVNFDYTRMQPVRIAIEEYAGFKLPIEAVRVIGGYEGVYIKDEVTIEFRRINVIYENDGYVICNGVPQDEDDTYSWIGQNDIVVVSGTELYSGKVVS